MKQLIYLIFFQMMAVAAICQTDSTSTNLLETLFRKQHPEGILYYTDRLGQLQITRMKEALQGRRFTGESSPRKFETFYLSTKEKNYLDSILRTLYLHYWQDSLFRNSKRIPEDSMWSRIQNQNEQFFKATQGDTTYLSTIQSIRSQVYNANTFQFSPVIFFRNKSICLIYFLRLCGSLCGIDDLTFYKLENGKYKRWFLLSGNAF